MTDVRRGDGGTRVDERESEETQDLRFTAPDPPIGDTRPMAPPSSAATGPTPPSVVPRPYESYPQGSYPQSPHQQAQYPQAPYPQAPYVQSPYPQAPYSQVPGAPGTGPGAPTNPQATASLVLGISSLFLSLLFVPSILGVVLGIVGVARSRRTDPPVGRGAAITGIVLSLAGAVLGVFAAAAVTDFVSDTARTIVEESATTPPDEEDGATTPDLEEFVRLDAAQWAAVADNPDEAEGRAVVLYAVVVQFDNSTGPDRFLAGAGVNQPGAEYELETKAVFIGEEALLDGVESGDVLKIHAVVQGGFTYENQIGGVSTVPALNVAKLEDVGMADLSKDVELGAIDPMAPGINRVPVTVTNSGTRTFDYFVDVVVESKDGKTTYDTSTAVVEGVKPGRTAETTVDFFVDLPADAVVRVELVERYPE
ncbi:DUF4190 domain-containing protein [Promicromonospora sp. NPDC060204]|uniref:DUF4190 domain-containing protein n=1 Tax=Promicromonospora sp. NPDC060204 TaxID=3347071 RepID=UPI003661BEFA